MTEHKNIYTALCAAQANMGKVTKGSINPAFKSRYAEDLAAITEEIARADAVRAESYRLTYATPDRSRPSPVTYTKDASYES